MDDQEARIRELFREIREAEQRLEGLRAELRRRMKSFLID